MPPKKESSTKRLGPDVLSELKDEISRLSTALTSKLSLLESAIHEVREGQAGIVQSMSFLNDKYEELKITAEKLEKENKELKANNKNLTKKVDDLSSEVRDLNQYHLEITGIPEQVNEKPEVKALKVALKVDQTITERDVGIAHRIGSQNDRKTRPIIVRFTNRRSRNAVYEGWRNMKNVSAKDIAIQGAPAGKIFINENLVPATRALIGEVNVARKKAGVVVDLFRVPVERRD